MLSCSASWRATILEPFVSGTGFNAINHTPFRGQFAYLAVMGFGVTYVRFSLRRSDGPAAVCL